jgi:hypothetical protein
MNKEYRSEERKLVKKRSGEGGRKKNGIAITNNE